MPSSCPRGPEQEAVAAATRRVRRPRAVQLVGSAAVQAARVGVGALEVRAATVVAWLEAGEPRAAAAALAVPAMQADASAAEDLEAATEASPAATGVTVEAQAMRRS